MAIVVVNHVFKHVTRRNNIVITSTGTLNNNTPLSIRINRLLSTWPCSSNAGISPSPLISLFHLEFFQQLPKHHTINPLWSALTPSTNLANKQTTTKTNIHLGIHRILTENCLTCLSNWQKWVIKCIGTLYYKLTIQRQLEAISGNKDFLLKENVIQLGENWEISGVPSLLCIMCDLIPDKCTLCT